MYLYVYTLFGPPPPTPTPWDIRHFKHSKIEFSREQHLDFNALLLLLYHILFIYPPSLHTQIHPIFLCISK
jgi:hypothetical protein